MFGVPLSSVVAEDCLVPAVVQDSINYMLAHGLKEEGMFSKLFICRGIELFLLCKSS